MFSLLLLSFMFLMNPLSKGEKEFYPLHVHMSVFLRDKKGGDNFKSFLLFGSFDMIFLFLFFHFAIDLKIIWWM